MSQSSNVILPPEYSHLKRPNPSNSLEGAGCSILSGLVWLLFCVIAVIVGIIEFNKNYSNGPEGKPPDPLFMVLYFGIAGLFIVITLWLVYRAIIARGNLRLLRSAGRQTQAVIFDRWEENDPDGDQAYYVAYAFKVPKAFGEQQVMTRAVRNHRLYVQCHIGDALTIRYLADKPSICQVIRYPPTRK